MTESIRPQAPSWKQIAAYWVGRNIPGFNKLACWDSGEPSCFACGWYNAGSDCDVNPAKGLERAHVIPYSRGGSNEVGNFALLCSRCHKESPDTTDASWFWKWVAECPYDDQPIMLAFREAEKVMGYLSEGERKAVASLLGTDDGRDLLVKKLVSASEAVGSIPHFGIGLSVTTKARLLIEVARNVIQEGKK